MRISNFFTDFIIIGVVAAFAAALPFCMLFPGECTLLVRSSKDQMHLMPIVIVVIYIIGIIFNQVADYIVRKMYDLPILRPIQEVRDSISTPGNTDHDRVQRVVLNSAAAYEYLSYRRSIIRIIRALIVFALSVLVLHGISVVVGSFFADLVWSWRNAVLVSCLIILLAITIPILLKVEIGYFRAIASFDEIISAMPSKGNAKVDRK